MLPQSAAAEDPGSAGETIWRVEARELAVDGWRTRLALGPDGNGFIGGSLAESRSRDLLWRLDGGHLEPATLPRPFSRAFVLDLDPAGALWIAPYDPSETATDDHLVVLHLSATATPDTTTPGSGHWLVESVRPGLWPQAMAMAGASSGWIGGNHAKLLELTSAGWREVDIALEPGMDSRDLNVLDIALASGGRGVLVGSRGLVARLEGGVWRQLAVPEALAGHLLFAIDLTPDGTAWIVGRGGVLARWHPDRAWQVEQPTTFTLLAIDMVNDQEGWAVGRAGTILHYRDGRWQRVSSPVAEDFFDLAMQDREHGWIVGQRSLLRGRPARSALPLVENTPGLLAGRPAQRLAATDLDGDGILDLILGESDEVRIFPRRSGGFGVGPVLPRPALPYADHFEGWALGDTDGDGAVDLLLLGEVAADRHLYHNDGAGTFTDTTATAGFGAFASQGDSAYWVDLDSDGDLDLYLARASLSGSLPLADQLYENDGRGHFLPRTLATGDVAIERTVIWGDLDGDGDPDAVIPAYYPFEARLYRNDGGELVDATAASGLQVATLEVNDGLLADLDLDGDLDLVLAGERLEIHRNDGFGSGGDLTRVASIASDLADARAVFCRSGDLDHDGRPELLVHWRGIDGSSTRVFANPAGDGYDGIGFEAGDGANGVSDLLAGLGPLADAVLADLDGDGDLDPLLTGPRGTMLLEGRQNDRRWLKVRLHGHRGTIQGTVVRVRAASRTGEGAPLLANVQTASGSAGLGEVHTGLGETSAVEVEVLFPAPGRRRVVLHDVAAGSVLDVHDTAMPWRLLVHASRSAERHLATPSSRRGALALAAAMAMALAGLRFLVARRRSERHCGAYRLGPVLGEGAMGVVHRARHLVSGHDVALKLLHPHLLRDETHRLRFLREARLMAASRHPALVRVEEAGEIDGRAFIAMELLEGRSLARHLEVRGALPAPTWRVVARALALALAALHERGIVHRDMKSENVFLLDSPADDWARRVRLMDLGLAWSEAQASLTRERVVVGTIATMAPERLQGARADTRTDLWSLGAVLYEAATGCLPFVAADGAALVRAILSAEPVPPGSRAAGLSEADEALILALLARDPAARPAGARAVVAAIDSATREADAGAVAAPISDEPPTRAAAPGPTMPETATRPTTDSTVEEWSTLYKTAREHIDAGRPIEADVAILACLQTLRRHLTELDPKRQLTYLARRDVRLVLDLSQHLERSLSDPHVIHDLGAGR